MPYHHTLMVRLGGGDQFISMIGLHATCIQHKTNITNVNVFFLIVLLPKDYFRFNGV